MSQGMDADSTPPHGKPVDTRPRFLRRLASLRRCQHKMAGDALLFAAAWVLAFVIRLEGLDERYRLILLLTLPVSVALKLVVFHYLGAYRSIWRYSSLFDLQRLSRATAISGVAILAMTFMLPHTVIIPRSVPFIDALLTLFLAGGLRMLVRTTYESSEQRIQVPRRAPAARRVLVVGATDKGERLVRELLRSERDRYDPVGFVDDDPNLHVQSIHGKPVLGRIADLRHLVREYSVDETLVALDSPSGDTIRQIVNLSTAAPVKILPDRRVDDSRFQTSDLREIQLGDLIGREPVDIDPTLVSAYLRGKRVLVTGAGGSIGAELCRQIIAFAPSEIVLLGRGEHSIYEIHRELATIAGSTQIHQVIGDVINKRKLVGVYDMHRPEIVFHAAADKHVPLMELNPDEAVLNNIHGTRNVLEVSNEYGTERVVCVSTDKAVNPTSVMGCCKRVAELLVQSGQYGNTVPVAVRFANVIGSRGSVIPLFERQLLDGGPITVTDRRIERYFMTIPEAASLVIQAGAMAHGGEIYVLDMGDPIKIWDLAMNLVRLRGLEPGTDIEIREVGLRPGEKLYEELSAQFESTSTTAHSKITRVLGPGVDADDLMPQIEALRQKALEMDFEGIRELLMLLVSEYQPEDGKEDIESQNTRGARPRIPARGVGIGGGVVPAVHMRLSGVGPEDS